jgi:hypothetical protein
VFPRLSAASLANECVALWSKFSDTLELDVHYDKRVSADAGKQ